MKVYIIGNKHCTEEFDNAERLLRQNGHIPINPVRILYALPEDINQSDYTVILFEVIRVCDAVYLLNGWKSDLYASMEAAHARRTDKEFLDQTDYF